jgi:O-antigen ligase
MRKIGSTLKATSGPFRALCVLLIAAFLFGGGARGDIESLIILRPLSMLILGYGLYGLKFSHIQANRFVAGMALAILALLVLHLLPMPPVWWGRLPGRDLITAIDKAAGLGQVWRPLSLAPDATLNAIEAALVPFAVLVLGLRLSARERQQLVGVVLILGGVSAVLGLAQVLDGTNQSLYFYKVTNDGKAVGLFANRNHQALMLSALLPMLAVWSQSSASGTKHASAARLFGFLAGLALLPLILITGSRAGLLLGAMALVLISVFFKPSNLRNSGAASASSTDILPRALLALPLTIVLICAGLVALTVWFGRAAAWQRLFVSAPGDDMRFLALPTIWTMIQSYFPFGTGVGSFERVYQIHEPDKLLEPTYMNHAHNDWLEVMLTGGLPAIVLMIVAITGFCIRSRTLLTGRVDQTPDVRLAWLGMVVILLAALASFSDYPLRVPSLACFFAVAVLWACCPLPKNQPDLLPS